MNRIIYISIFFLFLCFFVFNKVDSTDKDYWHRSGVTIITDNKTGLQYLVKPGLFGGGTITPRLKKDGTQMNSTEDTQ